jgi:DNA mismatch endonuclease Vsr
MHRGGTLQLVDPKTSRKMAANKSRGTMPELALATILRRRKIRFRRHLRSLAGTPDFVLLHCRVAIFCDGDFWHGRHWAARLARNEFKTRAEFWIDKIETNKRRDRRTSRKLQKSGWVVLRVWASDVIKSPERVGRRINRAVELAAAKNCIAGLSP